MIVSFDCYGTLIDWEEGILKAFTPVLKDAGLIVDREKILKLYSKYEPIFEREYRPYKDVLKLTAKAVLKDLGVYSPGYEDILVDSIKNWPPFEDTKEALLKIKEFTKIAIISNTDNDIIKFSVKNIGVDFDYIITAQIAKAYKPSLKVFEKAQEIFKVSKDEWIHVGQSVFHDIKPAKEFGIKSVRIIRRGYGATPEVEEEADYTFKNLKELAENLESIIHR